MVPITMVFSMIFGMNTFVLSDKLLVVKCCPEGYYMDNWYSCIPVETENSEDLEAQIRSMISCSEDSLRSAGISGNGKVHTCIVCGKRGENSNIKRHIESNHIAREAQCKKCGQTASSGHSLGRQTCLVDGGRCKSRRYGVSQNYRRH